MKLFKRTKNIKGQSTIEWTIITTAVVSLLLVVLGPNGHFSENFKDVLIASVDGMQKKGSEVGVLGHSGFGSAGSIYHSEGEEAGAPEAEEGEGQSAPAVPASPTSPEVGEEDT